MKKVLILGAGFGGLTAGSILAGHKQIEVTLVDKKTKYYMGLTKLWVMIGKNSPEHYMHQYSALPSRKEIKFVQDEIIDIDVNNKTVQTRKQTLAYDYLIIALGADVAPELIPDVKEHAINLYNMHGAVALHEKLKTFTKGRIALLICRPPYKCPAAPYETLFLLHDFFSKKGIRNNIKLEVYTPEPQPLPLAGPVIGSHITKMLEQKDIGYNYGHKVTQVDSMSITFENGKQISADLIIAIPPHIAPQVVKKAGLIDESSWIPVDKKTLATKFNNVYAIGDTTIIKLANGLALPKAGIFAEEQAKVVAQNIINEVMGKHEIIEFQGKGYCFLETGDNEATAIEGNFYGEPNPQLQLKETLAKYYKEKELFEQQRIKEWFS